MGKITEARKYGWLVLLAFGVLLILPTLVGCLPTATVGAPSDTIYETLLKNSFSYYSEALTAYNSGNQGDVARLLQEAANNAWPADFQLANLLERLIFKFKKTGQLDVDLARAIDVIFNKYNEEFGWSPDPLFDPAQPLIKPIRCELK